jgi:hypothetical protein
MFLFWFTNYREVSSVTLNTPKVEDHLSFDY